MTQYFERALFVVGASNSGKSTQLRSMFRDVRFGTAGNIPTANKLREVYRLSNERSLYVRITSPHETDETLTLPGAVNFLDKTEAKFTPASGSRWNFACPLQPDAHSNMPDVVETTRAFVTRFNPERVRVVFLNPQRNGVHLEGATQSAVVDRLRAIPSVETCSIDARERHANGLLLADFFDFT